MWSGICNNTFDYQSHLYFYSRILTTASRRSGWNGIVVNIDIYIALCVIKHNSEIKLIWRINGISDWGQAFATICVIIKVTYNLTPGDVRRLLVEMAQMGLYVTMTVTLPCIWQKRISAIKLIWCVNDISICGRAYVTIRLVIKVIYILTPGHNRLHLGLLANMGLYDTLKVTLLCIWQKRVS